MKKHLTAIVVMTSFAFASQFLTNGDFEEPLTVGWLQSVYGSNTIINRATDYDPDPDYEAYVYKYGYGTTGSGHARLYQTVEIPTTYIDFMVNAKIYAHDNHASAWCGAAVVIAYLSESNTLLGETRICARSVGCPWQNTATLHIISVPDSFWHSYSFNVHTELGNLPSADPSAVKKIQVALFDTTLSC